MRLHRLFVLAAALVLCTGVSNAVQFADGAKELVFQFAFTDTDDVGKNLDLEAALGFFVTPHNEVGPIIVYFKEDPDVGASFDATGIGAFYRYNFGTDSESWAPFVGVNAVWYGGDFGDFFDYAYQGEVGTRVMAGKRGAINISLFYEQLTGAGVTPDQDTFGLAAGLSIFFGND